MSTDNFGALGSDFFIKTFNKGSTMSQYDLDELVQYIQLTTTILAIGDFTADEQDSVWMILERVDVPTVPDYTVTNNTDVTMTSGGLVTINSMPWSKITGKPSLFSGNYNELTNKPTIPTVPTNVSAFTNDAGYLTSVGTISYNDLTNKPSIPSLDGYATEAWVNSQGFGSGGGSSVTDQISSGEYNVTVNESGVVTMNTARGSIEFGAQPEPGGPTHLHIMRPAGAEGATDLYFGDDYNYVKMPSSSYSAQGVEIGSSLNEGTVHTWRFGTGGDLTLPAGGDIKDSTGASVLGGGGSANTGNIEFSGDNITGSDGTVRMRTLDTTTTASYNFTPGNGDYSTAVWDGTGITFNDPTQSIYDAIWALTDFSTIEVQVASTWFTVTSAGSSTPGMPQAPTLWLNQTAEGGPLNIDVVDISIREGTESFIEVDGRDIEIDANDDLRMYANDTFKLTNRSSDEGIEIETNDGENRWTFRPDGGLDLPDNGDIYRNGTSVIPNLSSVATSGSYNDLNDKPNLLYRQVNAPTTSKGQPGDQLNDIAFDNLYIYYCVAYYNDGVADIWKRMAFDVYNVW